MARVMFTALLACIVAVSAQRKCGSIPSDATVSKMETSFKQSLRAKASGKFAGSSARAEPVIPTYFHVISVSNSTVDGYLAKGTIQKQMNVLNKAYDDTGLSFKLAGIDYTTSWDWFNNVGPETSAQDAMKKKLRKGDATTLNVYTVGFTAGESQGLLGYATFPSDYESAPKDDGVVILHSSLPGGISVPFNLGHTLTHEVGHWVGLYHTFQGGCSGSGDEVTDTAAEETPAAGCPIGRDSCPNIRGLDPIRNYMDYSDDACMNQFTNGQIKRLQDQMSTYRGINFD
jgi:hypothetical protein